MANTITGNISQITLPDNNSYLLRATAANITSYKNGIAYYSDTAGTFASTLAGTAGYLLQSNASNAPTWIQATNANTANTIVKRDASGNFSAGTITAALIGDVTGNCSGTSSTVSYQNNNLDFTKSNYDISSDWERNMSWFGDKNGNGIGRINFFAKTNGTNQISMQARRWNPSGNSGNGAVGSFAGITIISNRNNTTTCTIDGATTISGSITSTSGLILKHTGVDLKSATNNISDTNIFYMNSRDKNDYTFSTFEAGAEADGDVYAYFGVNNRNTSGTAQGWKGIKITSTKAGVVTYTVTATDKFREAIGVGASGTHDDNYFVKVSGDTMTDNLLLSKAGDIYVEAKNTTTGSSVILDSGSGTNHGIYSRGYSPTSTTFTADAKWMIYRNSAGTIIVNGNCTGNAASATQIYATNTTPASATAYYLLYSSTSTSGNTDARFNADLYYYDTGTTSYLNVGSASNSGAITLHNANGKYVNIVTSAFAENRTLTIPNISATIFTTAGGIVSDNITISKTLGNEGKFISEVTGYTDSKKLDVSMFVGSGKKNHGIYSSGYSTDGTTVTTDGKWMIYRNGSGTVIVNGNCTGNAGTATTWETSRTLTIGATGKSVNGSADVSWSATEILGSSTNTKFYRGDQTWSNTLAGPLVLYREGTTSDNNPAEISFSVKDTTTGKTYSSSYIRAYQDHGATPYGTNMVLHSGGNMFIGGGESPASLYATLVSSTSENFYATADGTMFLEAGANTIANRVGVSITTDGHVVPVKAEANNDKAQNLGASDAQWANVYTTAISAADNMTISTTAASKTITINSKSTLHLGTSAAASILFKINSTEVARFNTDGNLAMADEKSLIFKETRKKDSGGGWAFTPIQILDNGGTDFAHIGVHGSDNTMLFMYIGAGGYSGSNLRIFPNGTIGIASSSVIYNGSNTINLYFNRAASIETANKMGLIFMNYNTVNNKKCADRFYFRHYAYNSSGDSVETWEQYRLPAMSANLASTATYDILTTKDLSFSITGNAATATNVAWSGVTSKPTTLSGYGITNAVQYNGIDNDTGSNAAASSAKAYWANNDKVPKDKIIFAYNSSGTEYTTLFSNRNNQYGTILKWGYADRYIRILRAHPTSGSYNGWYSEDWEKIYAGYADSAARIDGNVTTCSDANNHNIWFSSNSSGSGIPNIASGIYITPSTKTITATTFAGSLSGNADTATKLAHTTLDSTTINNTAGSFAFSGSGAPWAGTDWVGLQIGDSADKFQISASGNSLVFRQNDSGGTNTSWLDWVTVLTSANYSSYRDYLHELSVRHSTWVKGTQISGDVGCSVQFVEKGSGTNPKNRLGMLYSYASGGTLNTRIGLWAYKNVADSTDADYFLLAYEWNGTTAVKRTYTDAKVYGAVWNDYAEFRKTNEKVKPGQVVVDNDDGSLNITYARLLPGAQVVSDTFGFAIGETEKTKTPLAVSGRVLVYTYQDRNKYHAGQAVCSAPNGTVDIMTRREIETYPDAIVGIVSEIPDYEEWGQDNVKVNGRIWIKVK